MPGPFNLEALKSKAGPLPVWQWALIGGGGIAILAYLRRPKGGATDTSANPVMLNPALSLFGGGGGLGGGGGSSSPPGTPPPTPPPGNPPPGCDTTRFVAGQPWFCNFVAQERHNPAFNLPFDRSYAKYGGSASFWQFVDTQTAATYTGSPVANFNALLKAWLASVSSHSSTSPGASAPAAFNPLHTSSVHAAHIAA